MESSSHSSTVTLLLWCALLTGCARQAAPSLPQDVHHDMRALAGYYRYVGPEIRIPTAEKAELQFNRKISVVSVPRHSPLRVTKEFDRLVVHSSEPLPETGTPIAIRTVDAREYKFRLEPAEATTPADRQLDVGITQVRERGDASPRAQLRADGGVALQRDAQLQPLRRSLLSGRAVAGVEALPELRGRVYAHNERITAVVESAFQSGQLIGYQLRVVNHLDAPLRVTRGLFSSDRLVSLSTERPVLNAASPRFANAVSSDQQDAVVYLIDHANPLGTLPRGVAGVQVGERQFLSRSAAAF